MLLARSRRDVTHGRWLPALLAVALVGAQGAALAHFAIVRHAYCPEHGELIHPDAERHAPAASHASKLPGLSASDEEGRGHEHEHCILRGHRREASLSAPAATALITAERHAPVLAAVAAAPAASPLFRLAPKQSPPA
jgi:hypothetical protein